jgi:hypothetical protein
VSDTFTIRTNNVPRDVLYWYELTDKERAEFDYLETEEEQAQATFVRYKGWTYDLGDFMRCPSSEQSNPQMRDAGFHHWDGYAGDSFFSGVLVRYVDDGERVIMGTYIA